MTPGPDLPASPFKARVFARRLLPLAVAACFTLPAAANPGGASVAAGQATFSVDGKTLTVANTPGTIINWQQFSIRPDEITRFLQQGASSAVLNRVTGGDPSQILGQLLSNGRVFLINPNGIAIGAGAVIDTAGFIASSLNISDGDFLSGRMKFAAVGAAGKVENHGTIRSQSGPIYLIAPTVENHGVIRAENGDVLLAAGKRVEIVAGASPHLRVEIDNAEGAEALNVGELVGRHASIYGTALRNAGAVNADRVTVTESGGIVLHASRDATLEASSRVSAGGAQGGSVRIEAGGTLLVDGVVAARGASGRGGDVQLLGERVGLVGNASVDVSGATGGGSILAGGDYQGANAAVRNAARTYVGPEATLRADATERGDGGKVIVWADAATRYAGAASARGGAAGGDGGLIEVSGKQYLDFQGTADTRAPRGATGTLLLDPADISITNTVDVPAGGSFVGGQFGGATGTATITWATIDAQLAGNNVVITTSGAGGAGGGDITVAAASPVLNHANDLWLVAHDAITVNGAITNTGTGGLRLYSGWNGVAFTYPTAPTLAASTTADITVNAPISFGGSVLMAASDAITVNRDILTSGAGSGITLRADADNNFAGNLAILAPTVATTVQTADGAIALSGVTVTVTGGAAAGRNVLVDAQGAGGTLDVLARHNVATTAGDFVLTGGSAANVTATVRSSGAQTIGATRDLIVAGGTAAGATATLALTADAAQTVDAGRNVLIRGSNTASANDAKGIVAGRGVQSVDAGGNLTIQGGTNAGTGKSGVLTNAPGAGAGSTTLRARGNFAETNNGANRAWLGADGSGALGDVTVTVQAGGNVGITSSLSVGGTAGITLAADAAFAAGDFWAADRFFAGSAQSAALASNNAGTLAFSAPVAATTVQTSNGAMALSGASVTLTGGAAAGRNLLVSAQGTNGTLDVLARNTGTGAGDLVITGGTAANVTAILESSGAQTIAATRDMTIAGGTAAGTTAMLRLTADAAQTIDVRRNLLVRGSNTANANDSKGMLSGRGTQSIDVGGNFTIQGGTGAGTGKSGVVTNTPGAGAGNTGIRVVGAFGETNNGANRAWLGADGSGTLGDVNLSILAGGNVGITSSTTVGGTADIVLRADATFAAAELWAANRFFAGSAQSAAVASNNAGNLAFTAPVGATTVQTTNGSIALSGVNVSLAGGTAANAAVLVSAQGVDGTLDVLARHTTAGTAGDVTITGGTGSAASATLQSAGAQTVGASRNVTITGGNASNAAAILSVTADAAQSIDAAGALTLQGGTGAAVSGSSASILGRGAQSIDVNGNVALASGAAGSGNNAVIDNAPSGTGTTAIRTRGNFTETNNGGGRAWLGAAGSGAFANVAVDVQAAGDITLASGVSTSGANGLSVLADRAYAAGDLWMANRFFAGSAASLASTADGFGGVFAASGAAAANVTLATASGPLTLVSAARNAANSADVDATLGTAANQFNLASTSGNIAVGDTAVSGAGNRSFRNVTVANPVATSGSIVIEANNALTANAAVNGDAGVTLVADADTSAAGALALNAGVATTTGDILLSGRGVTQAAATTVNAGAGTVTVDGNDGAIAFAGSTTTTSASAAAVLFRDAATVALGNVSAANGTLVLGLGGADALSGAVTQTAGTTITAGGLAGVTGANVTLANANDFTGPAGLVSSGNVAINDVNALSVGAITASGTVLATAGGNLTLAGDVNSSAGGNAIVLAAGPGGAFLNPAARTLSAPGGRWLVYSTDPAANTFGGLASGQQALWNRSYPAAVAETGNRYVFAIQPTVTVTSTDVTKTYGTDATATVAAAFVASGFVDASLHGGAFTQDTAANALTGSVTSAGSAPGASVAGSPYATVVSFTGPTGYAVTDDPAGRVFVDPADVTVTANDAAKTYGQTLTFTGAEFTATGLQNGETIGSVTLASAGAAATAGVAGGPYAITASNATGGTFNAGNYDITYADGALTVNPAGLTVTADDAAKAYGQTVAFTGTEFTASGLQNGETIGSVTLASAGAAPTAGVAGSPYAITASGATGGTFDPANYLIGYANGQLTVTPAAITVTASNQSKVYGDTLVFAGTEFTATGLANGETIGSVALASPGAAPTATVAGGPYAITASGATGGTFDPANYLIGYANGQLTVTPAAITVTASNQSKVYGDTLVFAGTEFTATGLANGETIGSVALASAGAAATATVVGGPYAITASGATGGTFDPANYTVGYVDGVLTLTPRSITVVADNQVKVYGTPDPALTFTAAGLVNGDTLAGALSRAPGETVPGGPYAITQGTVTDASNPNYAIGFTPGALTITPAALAIAANDATRLYGDANPAFTASFAGLTNGDTPADIAGLAFSTPATLASNVGSYAITPSGGANANYTITYTDGTLSITPAPLEIRANDASRLLGQPNPPFGATLTGFRLGQGLADLSGALGFATPATPASPPGAYAVTPFGVSSLNYAVTFVDGTLTVTAVAPAADTARDVALARSAALLPTLSGSTRCDTESERAGLREIAPGLCVQRSASR
jgi:filamentous hemagglutinin family protein